MYNQAKSNPNFLSSFQLYNFSFCCCVGWKQKMVLLPPSYAKVTPPFLMPLMPLLHRKLLHIPPRFHRLLRPRLDVFPIFFFVVFVV